MKPILLFLILSFSMTLFAQEKIYLDSPEVSVAHSTAILVRTNKTPKKVKVNFNVPMSSTSCQRYDTRYVTRTSGSYCGYATTYRIVTERICVRRHPSNNSCLRYETRQRRIAQRIARTCPVPETYCSQYGNSIHYQTDSVVLKFKKLPFLADSEEETFQVNATQKYHGSSAVIYDVKALETVQPYKIRDRGFLGSDKFVIKAK